MGMYLNPGPGLFKQSLRSLLYVDKTALAGRLNHVIGTDQKYVCVSRPRRFGKTMAGNMLTAYYGRTCDSREIFEGLAVGSDPTFEEHLNKYDVFRLNVQDFFREGVSAEDAIARLQARLSHEVVTAYPDISFFDTTVLSEVLGDAYAHTNTPFVFVVDEWDCVFRVHKEDGAAQKLYLDFVRDLFKDREYVALAYMTGILPIKKYGQHSALNMFTEVSMLDAVPYSDQTGFTEEEIDAICRDYHMDRAGMAQWYDGYNVDGISLYNPKSVVEATVIRGRFGDYWTRTETFEALRAYIVMDFDGLREKVVRLVADEQVSINTVTFQNDMTSMASADDVLTLLVHLGYLTYDRARGTVRIPNKEVREEFVACIQAGGWDEVAAAIQASKELVQALLDGDAERVAQGVAKAHRENASILTFNDENSLACVLSLAFYTARATYFMRRELPAGKGYADLVLEPRPGTGAVPVVIELKADGTPEEAIAQIRERCYTEGLAAPEQALLAGITYDRASKEHACRIERA